jgi:hypothetical protein
VPSRIGTDVVVVKKLAERALVAVEEASNEYAIELVVHRITTGRGVIIPPVNRLVVI